MWDLRPLTASSADRGLFVNRIQELSKAAAAVEVGATVLIAGVLGAGTTTLAQQLTATVDANWRFVHAATRDPSAALRTLFDQPVPDGLDERSGADLITDLPQNLHLVIDDPEPATARVLFGTLRDALWTRRDLRWVITTSRLPDIRTPATEPFFTTTLTLPGLNHTDAVDLLQRRAEPGTENGSLIHRIAESAPSTLPADLIRHAVRILTASNPEAALSASAPPDLTDQQLRLWTLIDIHGPLSPSDERIADALPVSRSRVAQILTELVNDGHLLRDRHGRTSQYRTTR